MASRRRLQDTESGFGGMDLCPSLTAGLGVLGIRQPSKIQKEIVQGILAGTHLWIEEEPGDGRRSAVWIAALQWACQRFCGHAQQQEVLVVTEDVPRLAAKLGRLGRGLHPHCWSEGELAYLGLLPHGRQIALCQPQALRASFARRESDLSCGLLVVDGARCMEGVADILRWGTPEATMRACVTRETSERHRAQWRMQFRTLAPQQELCVASRESGTGFSEYFVNIEQECHKLETMLDLFSCTAAAWVVVTSTSGKADELMEVSRSRSVADTTRSYSLFWGQRGVLFCSFSEMERVQATSSSTPLQMPQNHVVGLSPDRIENLAVLFYDIGTLQERTKCLAQFNHCPALKKIDILFPTTQEFGLISWRARDLPMHPFNF